MPSRKQPTTLFSRWQWRARSYVTIAVVLLGILLTVYCYYPGYMSADSFDQWIQAKTGAFSDWHPPVMSLLWGLLDRVTPGPVGMLVLQSVVFWSGVGVLISDLFGEDYLAWCLILMVGFFPSVFALLGTIWKDVQLGVSLVLATALYARAQTCAGTNRAKANRYCAVAVVLSGYALATRYDALAAVVPFLLWGAWILSSANLRDSSPGKKRRSTVVIGSALVVCLLLLTQAINAVLVKKRTMHPAQYLLIYDLVGTSLEAQTVLLPDELTKGALPASLDDLRRLYSPATADSIFWIDGRTRRLPLIRSDQEFNLLVKQWISAVPRHLKAYLTHRWNVFKVMLGIGQEEVYYPFQIGIDSNLYGLEVPRTRLNRWVMSNFQAEKNSLFFRVWFYLLLIPVAFGVAFFKAREHLVPVGVLGVSGLFNTLHYFVVGEAADFRYNWWTVCATLLMLCFVLAALSTKRASSRGRA